VEDGRPGLEKKGRGVKGSNEDIPDPCGRKMVGKRGGGLKRTSIVLRDFERREKRGGLPRLSNIRTELTRGKRRSFPKRKKNQEKGVKSVRIRLGGLRRLAQSSTPTGAKGGGKQKS